MKNVFGNICLRIVVQQHVFAFARKGNILRLCLEVSNNQQRFFSFSEVCHQVMLIFQIRDQIAVDNGLFIVRILAQSSQLFIKGQQRIRIILL